MDPFVLTEEDRQKITVLKENAEKNVIPKKEIIQMMMRLAPKVSQRPGFRASLSSGYLITFSMEMQNAGLTRHLAVSTQVNTPGLLPSVETVSILMKNFGFSFSFSECLTTVEDKRVRNVMEFVDPEMHKRIFPIKKVVCDH